MSEGAPETGWFGLPHSLVVAGLPVVGYALAFAYESGYIEWYGVPSWAIRIDLTQALVATAGLGASLTLIHGLMLLLPPRPWWRLLYLASAPAVMLTLALWVAGETEWVWGRHLITPLVLIGITGSLGVLLGYDSLIKPIRTHRDVKSWWDRWARRVQSSVTTRPRDLVDAFLDADASGVRRRLYLVGSLLWVSLVLASVYGARTASRQSQFWLSGSQPLCVAVRRYGDDFVCVAVDTARGLVQPDFRLVAADAPGEHWIRFRPRAFLTNEVPGRSKRFTPSRLSARR